MTDKEAFETLVRVLGIEAEKDIDFTGRVYWYLHGGLFVLPLNIIISEELGRMIEEVRETK